MVLLVWGEVWVLAGCVGCLCWLFWLLVFYDLCPKRLAMAAMRVVTPGFRLSSLC